MTENQAWKRVKNKHFANFCYIFFQILSKNGDDDFSKNLPGNILGYARTNSSEQHSASGGLHFVPICI